MQSPAANRPGTAGCHADIGLDAAVFAERPACGQIRAACRAVGDEHTVHRQRFAAFKDDLRHPIGTFDRRDRTGIDRQAGGTAACNAPPAVSSVTEDATGSRGASLLQCILSLPQHSDRLGKRKRRIPS